LLILFRELRCLCSVASDATLIHTPLGVLQSLLAELGFVAHLYPVVRAVGKLKYCTFVELGALRSARLLFVMDLDTRRIMKRRGFEGAGLSVSLIVRFKLSLLSTVAPREP
jgi:hypothetical protein